MTCPVLRHLIVSVRRDYPKRRRPRIEHAGTRGRFVSLISSVLYVASDLPQRTFCTRLTGLVCASRTIAGMSKFDGTAAPP
jgi:hypothetical protein